MTKCAECGQPILEGQPRCYWDGKKSSPELHMRPTDCVDALKRIIYEVMPYLREDAGEFVKGLVRSVPPDPNRYRPGLSAIPEVGE